MIRLSESCPFVIKLKAGVLITLALSIIGLAIEHSIESKMIGHITDTSQIERLLATETSHGAGTHGISSPKEIAYESVNMSYQYIVQSLPLPSQDLMPHGLDLGRYYNAVAQHFFNK